MQIETKNKCQSREKGGNVTCETDKVRAQSKETT